MAEDRPMTYRQFLEEYAKLLNTWLASNDRRDAENLAAPPWPLSVCPFWAVQDDGLLHMLVGPGERATGLRELRDFTRGAKRLVILDPYFFSGDRASASAYAEEVQKAARFGEVRDVHIVYDDSCTTKAVLTKVKAAASTAKVRLTVRSDSTIHDRVWIADRKRAVVVGTSLNGLGTRAAFILPLPEEDLAFIQEFLEGKGLGPRAAG